MKIKGIQTKQVKVELSLTTTEAITLLRQDFFDRVNNSLKRSGDIPLDLKRCGGKFTEFYVKDNALWGYHEDGRHPRNEEFDYKVVGDDKFHARAVKIMEAFTTLLHELP